MLHLFEPINERCECSSDIFSNIRHKALDSCFIIDYAMRCIYYTTRRRCARNGARTFDVRGVQSLGNDEVSSIYGVRGSECDRGRSKGRGANVCYSSPSQVFPLMLIVDAIPRVN
jgi:hypothetical protein